MKALSAGYDKNGSAMQSNRQKADLLTRQINVQKQKLAEQNRMLDESTKKFGENDRKTESWRETVNRTKATIGELEQELKKVPNALQTIGAGLQTAGQKLQSVGRGLTMGLTVPIVGLTTAAVKVASDFDAAMSKVQAVSGATGADLEKLRAKAVEMGESTIFSATESAEALNYMAMAGWKTEDMLNGIAGVMNLAAAGGEDLATTSDIVTDALTAFGESAEESGRLADIMAAAASNSNTNIAMMGETFKYAAPIAGTLGYSMEDLAVATGLMANAGIKATNAGTALRAGLTRLAAPPKQAREAMEQYGISITNTDGTMKDFGEVMDIIREKLGGLTEEEQAAALKAIFGQNAISGWAAVLNASQADFDALSMAINNSSGAAERMADTMKDNLAGEIKLLKSELESTGITFGEVIMPYLRQGVKGLKTLIERFKKLNPEQQKLILKLMAIAAAAGPVLSILGKLTTVVGGVAKGIGSLVKTVSSVASGMSGLATAGQAATGAQLALNGAMAAAPFAAFGAAIGGIVIAFATLPETMRKVGSELINLGEIENGIATSNEEIVASMREYGDAMRNAGSDSTTAAIQAEAAAKSLAELAKSGDTSETNIAKMAVAVRQLNDIFPELGLELDRSSGKLSKSGNEIQAFIDKVKDTSAMERASEQLKTSLDEITTSTQQVAEAQSQLDMALDKKDLITQQIDGLTTLLEQWRQHKLTIDEFRTGVEALNSEWTLTDQAFLKIGQDAWDMETYTQYLTAGLGELDAEIASARDGLEGANIKLQTANDLAAKSQMTVDALTASQQANTQALNENGIALDQYSTKTEFAGTTTGELMARQQEMAANAAAAMTQLQESVTQALGSQMNMFEQFDQKSAMSTTELLSNMQSQIDGVTQWEENLAALAEKGINQDLLQKLAAMGPEGAGYVATFNQMSTEELSKANELWLQGLNIQGFGNEAGLELQEAVGQMSVGTEGAWQQLGADMGIKAKGAAGFIGQGLIEGVQAKQAEVDAAAQESGDETIDSLETGLGVNSPSWKAREAGRYVDLGLADGIRNNKPIIQAAVNSITQFVESNFINKLKGYQPQMQTVGLGLITHLATGMRSGQGNVNSSISGIVSAVQQGGSQIQSQQSSWNAAGMALSQGLAQGIAAGQSAVIAAAVAVASAAIAAAQSTLVIGSPSKVADKEIGRQFDAGIVRGINHNRDDVWDAVSRMSDGMVVTNAVSPMAAMAGGGTVSNYEYGGTTINVYGSEGQDVDELANVISRKIDFALNKHERARGMAR